MATLMKYQISPIRILIRSISSSTFKKSNAVVQTDTNASVSDTDNEINKSVSNLTEEQINECRDVSRMPKKYHDRMSHVLEPPEPLDYYNSLFQLKSQKQRLFAKYGQKSGIAPGIAWPSQEELQEIIAFEKEWEPNLQAMWKNIEEMKSLEEKERKAKLEHVEKQLAKMPEYVKQFRAKLAKAEVADRQRQEKHKALMEEVRDFFGYNLDPKDPRVEKMQLEKEEEEKKMKKKKKREEKLAKLMQFMKNNS